MLEGETQFCKIDAERKSSPLTVAVEMIEGSCEIYISSKQARPDRKSCEMKLYGTMSGVNNESPTNNKAEYIYNCKYKRFQDKYIHFGIFAYSHAVLKLELRFGCHQSGSYSPCKQIEKKDKPEEIRRNFGTRAIIAKINEQIRLLKTNKGLFNQLKEEVGILISPQTSSHIA